MSYQNVIFTLILTSRKYFNNIAVKTICIHIAHSLQYVNFITTITLYLFLIRLVIVLLNTSIRHSNFQNIFILLESL